MLLRVHLFVIVNTRYSIFIVLQCVITDIVLFHHNQVTSKGYKVYGEASSVCGTITINKRKVNGQSYEDLVLTFALGVNESHCKREASSYLHTVESFS